MSAGLKKKVGGKFIDVASDPLFRGDWQADTLVKQFDFATTGLSGFTTRLVGPDSQEPVVRVSTDVAFNAGETEPPGSPDPLFTHAIRARSHTKNGTATDGTRFTQLSEFALDLASLEIPNISRLEFWMGADSGYSHFRTYTKVNSTERESTTGERAWEKLSVVAGSSDVVTWGVCSNNNLYGSIVVLGFTGLRIYTSQDPYMLGDFVTYQGKMWKSEIDNNANVPGVDSTWTERLSLPVSRGTTAERPDAVVVGAGFYYYDTTLGRPIWSNDTAWTDAGGVVV